MIGLRVFYCYGRHASVAESALTVAPATCTDWFSFNIPDYATYIGCVGPGTQHVRGIFVFLVGAGLKCVMFQHRGRIYSFVFLVFLTA